MKAQKVQPGTIKRIACEKCKELLVKVYPYAGFTTNVQVACGKCVNKKVANN